MPYPRTKHVRYLCLCCWLWTGWLGEGQYAQAQDKSGAPTVKMRRKKKKVKKVDPNRRGRPVRDNYRRPASEKITFPYNDRYYPPRSISGSEEVKDNYKRPKSITHSGNVKVSDAQPFSEPDAEEGRDRSHLPLIDRVFNRHNRYFRQKERYLQNLSFQLGGYQGDGRIRKQHVAPGGGRVDKSVGRFIGRVRIPSRPAQRRAYEKISQGSMSFAGHIRRLRPPLQEKVEKNKAYYITGHPGWLRVSTPRAQARYHRKLADRVHRHQGYIRVRRRRPGEHMHPSVHHLARVGKASYEQKERHRKRRIWITHIFKSREQPQHLKEKTRKPRYDSKEADIWNY